MNKKIMTLCLSGALCAASCSSPKPQPAPASQTWANASELWLLVGSYASPEEEGIQIYRFNQTTGEASYQSGLKGCSNPSYLTPSADGTRVYAVSEEEGLTAAAVALQLNPQEGVLTLLNSQLTQGGAPCFIALSPDEKHVVTANYMGGSISIFGLDESGKLLPHPQVIPFNGQGTNPERQEQPHLHQVNFTPDGQYLLANDLGTDRLYTFPLPNPTKSPSTDQFIDEGQRTDIPVAAETGPRHLCFHPNGKWAYLLGELSGQVTTFAYEAGRLTALQSVAADTVQAQGSADIHCSPDGRFVYASNRLKADGLAIFAVDAEQGTLTPVGYQPTGIHPRNFLLSPNGDFLLVACRDSHCIQIFHRHAKTGLLTDTGQRIETSRPVCLQWTGIR